MKIEAHLPISAMSGDVGNSGFPILAMSAISGFAMPAMTCDAGDHGDYPCHPDRSRATPSREAEWKDPEDANRAECRNREFSRDTGFASHHLLIGNCCLFDFKELFTL